MQLNLNYRTMLGNFMLGTLDKLLLESLLVLSEF